MSDMEWFNLKGLNYDQIKQQNHDEIWNGFAALENFDDYLEINRIWEVS
jgi:hypothetical protein